MRFIAENANYGLLVSNVTWLDNERTLHSYALKNGDTLEYRSKVRAITIRLLDGQQCVLDVDDSQLVGHMMAYICSQMGIANYEEYSLIQHWHEQQVADQHHDGPHASAHGANSIQSSASLTASTLIERTKTLTLKRHDNKTLTRDSKKMDELKRKLHTDDDSASFSPLSFQLRFFRFLDI